VSGTWPNGCTTARGIAVDPGRGWVIVACEEGRVVVLDEHSGSMLGTVTTGGGVEQIAYDARRVRLYVPATVKAAMGIVTMDNKGVPTLLGSVQTSADGRCAVTPGAGEVFVCVPSKGQLVFLFDPFP
jgi:DNA-binding beta-propeller fold protein YncE